MDADLNLFDRWCGGDREAGNELFERHFESIRRFFERKVESDARDLIQETFLACLRGRDRFRKHSSFRTYLFGIARLTLYTYWRKQRRKLEEPIDFGSSSLQDLRTPVSRQVARKQEGQILVEVLETLPLETQTLLELHYWQGMDSNELAEIFEVKRTTIRSRLSRARTILREKLGNPGLEDDIRFESWVRSQKA